MSGQIAHVNVDRGALPGRPGRRRRPMIWAGEAGIGTRLIHELAAGSRRPTGLMRARREGTA